MKVVVTGGGTGGHIYPALAVAEALRRHDPGVDLHFIGGTTGPETDIVPKAGIPFLAVKSKKLRKLASVSSLGVLWALWQGYREASSFLRDYKPDVVISTGGYVAAATALAAARQKRPLITQACDAIPGRTNLWLAKYATHICVWFEDTKSYFPAGKPVATGVPLREGIVCSVSQQAARAKLGLQEELLTLLVIGGSQGARRLNELIVGTLSHLPDGMQILHQAGARNIEDVMKALAGREDTRIPYVARAYLDGEQVALAYRTADIVVCRCGISTLAEVTANGIAALMVPLPSAYADHQTANAREVVKAGGGRLLPEGSLPPEELARSVSELMLNSDLRNRMSEAGRFLGRPEAANEIARIAMSIGSGQHA